VKHLTGGPNLDAEAKEGMQADQGHSAGLAAEHGPAGTSLPADPRRSLVDVDHSRHIDTLDFRPRIGDCLTKGTGG